MIRRFLPSADRKDEPRQLPASAPEATVPSLPESSPPAPLPELELEADVVTPEPEPELEAEIVAPELELEVDVVTPELEAEVAVRELEERRSRRIRRVARRRRAFVDAASARMVRWTRSRPSIPREHAVSAARVPLLAARCERWPRPRGLPSGEGVERDVPGGWDHLVFHSRRARRGDDPLHVDEAFPVVRARDSPSQRRAITADLVVRPGVHAGRARVVDREGALCRGSQERAADRRLGGGLRLEGHIGRVREARRERQLDMADTRARAVDGDALSCHGVRGAVVGRAWA